VKKKTYVLDIKGFFPIATIYKLFYNIHYPETVENTYSIFVCCVSCSHWSI